MSGSSILFDAPDGTPIDRSFLESLGHPVVVCHGPGENSCPMLSGEACPLADEAHGIVFMLDLERSEHRAVLDRYKRVLRHDVPIAVVVRDRSQAGEHAGLLAGLRVWDHQPVAGDLDALIAETDAADLP